MPLRSTCAETWRGADNSRCTWEPFPESPGARGVRRTQHTRTPLFAPKKKWQVFFSSDLRHAPPARSPAVAQRRGELDDGQEGQGRRGDGQKAGRAIFVSCAHAVRTTRPRPRAACARIKGPRTCAGPCPHRRRALWRVPALCWRAPVVTCAHALRQLCAHAPTPAALRPGLHRRAKSQGSPSQGLPTATAQTSRPIARSIPPHSRRRLPVCGSSWYVRALLSSLLALALPSC